MSGWELTASPKRENGGIAITENPHSFKVSIDCGQILQSTIAVVFFISQSNKKPPKEIGGFLFIYARSTLPERRQREQT
jgi:hypothetical protein